MGLRLSWADRVRYRAIANYPGMEGQAYTAREQFIEKLLEQQAPEDAFARKNRNPYMAGYNLGQEQTEISQKLGQGVNDLFAPIQQELTKALQNIEQSGELEKFDAWSKTAGQSLSEFFQKVIEPKLPGALTSLEQLFDKLGQTIDRLVGNEQKIEGAWNWFQNPNPEHKNFGERMGDFWHWLQGGFGSISKSMGDTVLEADQRANKINTPSSKGVASATSIYDTVPHFAAGGIVNSPTYSLIGEKGPEAVIPLSFLGSDTRDISKAGTEDAKANTDVLKTSTDAIDRLEATTREYLDFLERQSENEDGSQGKVRKPWPRNPVNLAQTLIGSGGGKYSDLTGADGSLATREEYDWEGHSSQYGPKGNRLITGWNYLGLHPDTMAKYGLSQGDLVRTEAGWSRIQESNSRRGTIEFHADYPGQFQNQRSRLHILETKKASEEGTTSTSRGDVNISYKVDVHAHGHDVNSVKTAVVEALRVHSDELGHHIRRVLQENFRDEQRAGYA